MNVRVEECDGRCRVVLEGEMTVYRAAELKRHLLESLERAEELDITLGGVSEIDTSGFQLLVLIKHEAARRGKRVRLTDHSPAVLEVLDTFNAAAALGDPLVLPGDGRSASPRRRKGGKRQ